MTVVLTNYTNNSLHINIDQLKKADHHTGRSLWGRLCNQMQSSALYGDSFSCFLQLCMRKLVTSHGTRKRTSEVDSSLTDLATLTNISDANFSTGRMSIVNVYEILDFYTNASQRI